MLYKRRDQNEVINRARPATKGFTIIPLQMEALLRS